jgi:hypothetical protein
MIADFGHLQVCCGPYRILVPVENIGGIESDAACLFAHSPVREARRLERPLVIDARALLGLEAKPEEIGACIYWRRMDDRVRAALLVDRIDSLRSGVEADFLPPPLVPRAFHHMFDLLLIAEDGHFLMRLRQDVSLNLDDRASRRRLSHAIRGVLSPEQWPAARTNC